MRNLCNPDLLIIDDNKELLFALKLFLAPHFKSIQTLSNPNAIISQLEQNSFDMILLDMNFSAGVNSGNEGLYWMHRILEVNPGACIVLITAFGDVSLAVKAIKEGAADFIEKSWDEERILTTLQGVWEQRCAREEIRDLKQKQQHLNKQLNPTGNMVMGPSRAMQSVMDTVRKVGPTDANVLITGENGTGKELIAREIHNFSQRSNEVFVGVDMGAITETLFESELFGHRKGAFTDARDDRPGRFEIASGGTLFMDEVGNLPMHLQAKLLSALQNREVTPLGATRSIPVDIRLVSATNADIRQRVRDGAFRDDLLYRLNTIHIHLPALRERPEDIPTLAQYFLAKYASQYNKGSLSLSVSALKKLVAHPWDGNIRELQHVMEKTAILSDRSLLRGEDILLETHEGQKSRSPESFNLIENERELIQGALHHCKGNVSLAARSLGINRSTLYDKMKRYDL